MNKRRQQGQVGRRGQDRGDGRRRQRREAAHQAVDREQHEGGLRRARAADRRHEPPPDRYGGDRRLRAAGFPGTSRGGAASRDRPAQSVREFARAMGKRAKTDPIDALMIAYFAEVRQPEVVPLPTANQDRLADLRGLRTDLIEASGTVRVLRSRARQSHPYSRTRRWMVRRFFILRRSP